MSSLYLSFEHGVSADDLMQKDVGCVEEMKTMLLSTDVFAQATEEADKCGDAVTRDQLMAVSHLHLLASSVFDLVAWWTKDSSREHRKIDKGSVKLVTVLRLKLADCEQIEGTKVENLFSNHAERGHCPMLDEFKWCPDMLCVARTVISKVTDAWKNDCSDLVLMAFRKNSAW